MNRLLGESPHLARAQPARQGVALTALDFFPSVGAWSGREELGKLREKRIQDSRHAFSRPTVKVAPAGGSMSVSFRSTVKISWPLRHELHLGECREINVLSCR